MWILQNASNPNEMAGLGGVAGAQPAPGIGDLSLEALQERLRQLESENAQLRFEVHVLRDLLLDE